MASLIGVLRKYKIFIVPCLLFFILTAGMLTFNLIIVDYIDGYMVRVNDKLISIVKSRDDILKRLGILQRQIETEKNIEIVFDDDLLHYETTEATLNEFSSVAEIDKNLKENLTYRCKVWALRVNDIETVYLRTKEEIEALIDKFTVYFVPKTRSDEIIENLSTTILENLKITEGLAYFDAIANIDEAFAYLLHGSRTLESYVVQAGDTLYYISKKFNITYTDLISANPSMDPQKLRIGETISLTVPKPYINVEITYRHIYDQIIFPPVITLLDNSMIRTRIDVDAEGEQGEKRVYADKVYLNEKEKSVQIIREQILKEPKVRILRIGTLRTPDDILVAQSFLPPGIGVISDYFGAPRWGGRFHIGIDIAVNENTPIHAWKGGIIKEAGWSTAGYGYLIVIEHDDGTQSYYGHNNSVAVKVGQRVEQGEIISYSGNTGISTGPHVHFEIRVDNKPLDPLQYLKTH